MKLIHSNKVLILLLMMVVGLTSCDEYLEEDNRSFVDTEYFYSTPDGMDALITAAYATGKIWYGKEEGFDFTVPGTDIYDYGQQHPFQYQYTFTTDFNPTNSRLVILWVELYKGINSCNEAIARLSDPEATPFDEEETARKLAEVRFLRAHYNWLIVETWGGAVLRTEPVEGVIKTATRSSVQEFYDLIFEDLDYAVNNLDPSDNMSSDGWGRVTRDAALAFRARMHLTRGSQLDDQTHYTAAAEDAAAVVNSGNYPLYENYEDVWDIENNQGDNQEAVWVINYSRSIYALLGVNPDDYTSYQRPEDKPWDEREGGHHGHLMFGQQYDVIPGMTRDVENGRPFRRYFANKYLIDAFNEDVDERFYGSFKTVWISNDPLPDAEQFQWPIEGYDFHTDQAGEPLFEVGDTAIVITKENYDNDVIYEELIPAYHFNVERGYWIFDYQRLFNEDGTANEVGSNNRNNTFELSKFADPTRPAATDAGSQNGIRDHMVIRISEMYLTAAEALWRTGQGDAAYNDYLIPLANMRSFDGDGASLLSSYDIESGDDLTIEFFLAERARELCGEQLRWFDLKRQGPAEMVSIIQEYAGNTEARENFSEKFTLRPIPQVQFDAITNKDEFEQNPGYD